MGSYMYMPVLCCVMYNVHGEYTAIVGRKICNWCACINGIIMHMNIEHEIFSGCSIPLSLYTSNLHHHHCITVSHFLWIFTLLPCMCICSRVVFGSVGMYMYQKTCFWSKNVTKTSVLLLPQVSRVESVAGSLLCAAKDACYFIQASRRLRVIPWIIYLFTSIRHVCSHVCDHLTVVT